MRPLRFSQRRLFGRAGCFCSPWTVTHAARRRTGLQCYGVRCWWVWLFHRVSIAPCLLPARIDLIFLTSAEECQFSGYGVR